MKVSEEPVIPEDAIVDDELESGEATLDSAGGGRDSVDEEDRANEVAELQDRLLRTQADLENYRKRTAREMESGRRYGALPLIRDLLPVLDNVRRAIEAANQGGEDAGLLEGFRMVAQQLETVFAQHHCTEIDALEQAFDPNLHEAVNRMPSAEHPPGTVLVVICAGYTLHDRVVRPAQVVVAMEASPSSSAEDLSETASPPSAERPES